MEYYNLGYKFTDNLRDYKAIGRNNDNIRDVFKFLMTKFM